MSEMKEQHSLRIFTIISQIEQMLESAPRPKIGGAGNRRIVDVGEVFDLLGDLKVTIPEDIRRANSVLLDADTLLEHANEEAVDIVDQAQKEADQLHQQGLGELEDMRRAAEDEFEKRVASDHVLLEVQRRAELLQQHAEHSANTVYDGAKQYADAILEHLQTYLMENYHRVEQNRAELGVIAAQPPIAQPSYPPQAGPAPMGGQPQPGSYTTHTARPVAQQSAATAAAAETIPANKNARAAQAMRPAIQEPEPPIEELLDDFQQQEEEKELFEPKRRRSIFRRAEEDLFSEDESSPTFAEPHETPLPSRRSRRRMQADELDIDLDE